MTDAPPEPRWHDAELDAALDRCRATHTGVNPCYGVEYMAARRQYHTLLVARGLMRRKDMDRDRLHDDERR